ncbi:NAD(P)-binding protein, partial [Clavulina sp. PMI_390]
RAHSRGHPRQVVTLDEIPVPKPAPGQALIKVHAVGLNPVGFKMIGMVPNFATKRPHVVEYDFCGTVIESNGSPFKLDDVLWGCCFGAIRGSMAQYLVVDHEFAAVKPDCLSIEEAAGLGMAGITAEQAIYGAASVKPGQSVLVVGGNSGVGSLMIKMLKQLECKVYASCSGRNVELVKSLGADVVYDYTVSRLSTQIAAQPPSPKFDYIIDVIGSSYNTFVHSEKYLAPEGKYINVGSPVVGLLTAIQFLGGGMWARRPTWLGGTDRQWLFMLAKGDGKTCARVNDIVNKGSVAPLVDKVYEFTDLLNAYDYIMTGRAKGKVIVRVP